MCASGVRSRSAVDKRDVVALTLFGQGAPTISPIPPTSPFYAHDIVIPKADPAAARKLLAEAGHPNGLKIQLIVPVGRPVRERLGVTLQQLAQARRLRHRCSAGSVFQLRRGGFRQGAVLHRRLFRTPDGRYQHLSVPAFERELERKILALQEHARWTAALDAARQTGDQQKQKVDYIAMQQALNEDPAASLPIR